MSNPLFIFFVPLLFLLAIELLIISTKRIKVQGMLKKFLAVAGYSAAGFLVSVLLHNVVSALLSSVLKREVDEPIFFILGALVFPVGFAVGVIGSIIQLIKQRKGSHEKPD